jgi:hypothetical protein
MIKSSLMKICGAAILALMFVGCSAPDKASTTTTNTAEVAKETKTTDIKGSTSSPTPAAQTSNDQIGVAECDDYLTKYEACIRNKVPAAAQSQYESAFTAARNGYKSAASTPQGKAALAQACKQALETTKTSLASFNCTW